MAPNAMILQAVRDELGKEPRIVPSLHAISLRYDNGLLFMAGELATVAAKMLALERVARLCCVLGIVDSLHVAPSVRMSDGGIAHQVRQALLQDSELKGGRPGRIDVAVKAGVVTLTGEVASLDHKRLAGMLAWWSPGRRDVLNAIAVEPPDEDTDAALVEALRLTLEKDSQVASGHIRIAAQDGVVFLAGCVRTSAERDRAEDDAWSLFGVDRVENAISTGPINLGYRAGGSSPAG